MKNWKTKRIKEKRKIKGKTILKIFVFLIVFLVAASFIFLLVNFIIASRELPEPGKLLTRNINLSTKIYDRKGETMLYEIFNEERRTLIKFSDIPKSVINATIVAEDREFFKHQGFNLKGMARALLVNIFQGKPVQGGSSLTQQFIKNAFLSPKKLFSRKIKELFLAYQIEKKYTKEEILQMYFNEIPYGSNAYGIAEASQIYFGKNPSSLTLDEAALLASLTKAPTYYSPYGSHQEDLIGRRDYILNALAEEGYYNKEETEQAKKVDTLAKIIPKKENIIAPHFVFYVKELLVNKYGERLVEQGGLKVITSLDIEKQKIAEETIDKYAENNQKKFNASNAALVALDVKTGEVLAMVGSRDFFNEEIQGQVNVSLKPRQPGSSLKPFVYAAAFIKGYTPQTLLFDAKTNFGPPGPYQPSYSPNNYDFKEYGPMTMRQALAGSRNIPAVETLYLVGKDNFFDLLLKLGYTTLDDKDRYGLSLALGSSEVNLLEHTTAFSVLAREGIKIPSQAILKIEDSQGNVLEDNTKTKPSEEKIFEPQICRLVSNILSDNGARAYVFGTKNYLTLDRPVAVKTGTSNEFHDAWTVGYTPDLAAGVWVGNNDNSEMKPGADGADTAAPIWRDFMSQSLKSTPANNFTPPSFVKTGKPILDGEFPEEIILKVDKASGKLATTSTPETFIEEKTFKAPHSILHYVDKDNPLGPAPTNPEKDPQYLRWEEALKKWIDSTKIENPFPPVSPDDLHTLANKPNIKIIFPYDGFSTDKEYVVLKAEASAKRKISRIKCLIDEIPIDLDEKSPYECLIPFSGLDMGEHKIKVIAFDDIDNSNEKEIIIYLERGFEKKIFWLKPKEGEIISSSDFPYEIFLRPYLVKVNQVKFYTFKEETGEELLLGTILNPEINREFVLTIKNLDKGRYKLRAEIKTENETILSPETEFEVK